MHILRPRNYSFAFISHLLFFEFVFQSRHLKAHYKRCLSVVRKRHVSTDNRRVLSCGKAAILIFSLK